MKTLGLEWVRLGYGPENPTGFIVDALRKAGGPEAGPALREMLAACGDCPMRTTLEEAVHAFERPGSGPAEKPASVDALAELAAQLTRSGNEQVEGLFRRYYEAHRNGLPLEEWRYTTQGIALEQQIEPIRGGEVVVMAKADGRKFFEYRVNNLPKLSAEISADGADATRVLQEKIAQIANALLEDKTFKAKMQALGVAMTPQGAENALKTLGSNPRSFLGIFGLAAEGSIRRTRLYDLKEKMIFLSPAVKAAAWLRSRRRQSADKAYSAEKKTANAAYESEMARIYGPSGKPELGLLIAAEEKARLAAQAKARLDESLAKALGRAQEAVNRFGSSPLHDSNFLQQQRDEVENAVARRYLDHVRNRLPAIRKKAGAFPKWARMQGVLPENVRQYFDSRWNEQDPRVLLFVAKEYQKAVEARGVWGVLAPLTLEDFIRRDFKSWVEGERKKRAVAAPANEPAGDVEFKDLHPL